VIGHGWKTVGEDGRMKDISGGETEEVTGFLGKRGRWSSAKSVCAGLGCWI
jgi:hypothetical protein